MRILAIGGTRFSGRAFTLAAQKAGHAVTVFHRGPTGDDLPVEHVHGDRTDDLGPLVDRSFDAVVDFCGYLPRHVRASGERFADARRYVFVSTISVHPLELLPGSDEDSPRHDAATPDVQEVTGDTYGPLKVACEDVVRVTFGDRATVVRPGFIVGPRDPTDRFPSLVRRAAAGGEMLVPGPSDAALQFVDSRDLAGFLLHLVETDRSGVFNAVHPRRSVSIGDVVEAARELAAADTTFTWVDPDWLLAELTDDERTAAFPLWGPEYPGLHEVDGSRGEAAGLENRPIRETVRDILTWWDAAEREPEHGLASERERELLEMWRARP